MKKNTNDNSLQTTLKSYVLNKYEQFKVNIFFIVVL
jgi:hypothetical protein